MMVFHGHNYQHSQTKNHKIKLEVSNSKPINYNESYIIANKVDDNTFLVSNIRILIPKILREIDLNSVDLLCKPISISYKPSPPASCDNATPKPQITW